MGIQSQQRDSSLLSCCSFASHVGVGAVPEALKMQQEKGCQSCHDQCCDQTVATEHNKDHQAEHQPRK